MNICQFEVACDQISMKMFLLAKRISKAYSHAKWFENSSLTLTKLSHGIWYLNYSVCSLLSMGKCVAGAWKSVTKDLLSNVSEWKEIITSQIEKVLQHKMWCMELDKVERNISIYIHNTHSCHWRMKYKFIKFMLGFDTQQENNIIIVVCVAFFSVVDKQIRFSASLIFHPHNYKTSEQSLFSQLTNQTKKICLPSFIVLMFMISSSSFCGYRYCCCCFFFFHSLWLGNRNALSGVRWDNITVS